MTNPSTNEVTAAPSIPTFDHDNIDTAVHQARSLAVLLAMCIDMAQQEREAFQAIADLLEKPCAILSRGGCGK